ncbi:uncharacterized protein AMSG_11472, partial [Thecamonas trahens ATCC 50062]
CSSDGSHHGPTKDRGCTDILFLLLFILFWVGMVVVGSMALDRGQPERLLYGTDSYGNLCSKQNNDVSDGEPWRDMRGKSKLFFGNPFVPDKLQVCVSACPTEFSKNTGLTRADVECRVNTTDDSTNYFTATWLRGCVTDDNCPCYIRYPSFELLNRCIPGPEFDNETRSEIANSEAGETVREMLGDVINAKYIILACAGGALLLSFIWLIMLRCCGGFMVWTTVVLTVMAMIAVTALFIVYAGRAKETYDERKAEGTETTRLRANYMTLYVLGGLGGLIVFIAFLALLFMRTEINRAIEIVKEAARTLGHIPMLVFFPIFVVIVLAGFLAYWVVVMIYLATAGDPVFTRVGLLDNEPPRLLEYKADNTLRQLQAYHVFGGLWTVNLLLAFNEMVIAGAVAHHYFREGTSHILRFPLLAAVWQTMRYHLGTLAFGSLIIAIVQFIRLVLIFVQKRLEAANNRVADFIFACLHYAFLCLERFLRFISRNAYIITAIRGSSFCSSARTAFHLLTSNALSLLALTFVSNFLILLGKIVVVAITGLVGLVWLKTRDDLQYYAIPLILIIFAAYAISALFTTVFEMTIDTIFLCYCIDLDEYDGRYMSPSLRAFTDAHAPPRKSSNSGSRSRSRSRTRSRSRSPRPAYEQRSHH